MQKVVKILLFVVISIGIFTPMFLAFCFRRIENMVLLLDNRLQSIRPEIMDISVRENYPLSIYMKDIIVYVGLYRDISIFVAILITIATLFLIFACRKTDKAK
ncbi:MAG: hypothetical protein PHP01_08890 [Phycisphaerae bacterium]|nr:hypothetical protein [Phycisphaerae bacterium]